MHHLLYAYILASITNTLSEIFVYLFNPHDKYIIYTSSTPLSQLDSVIVLQHVSYETKG